MPVFNINEIVFIFLLNLNKTQYSPTQDKPVA